MVGRAAQGNPWIFKEYSIISKGEILDEPLAQEK